MLFKEVLNPFRFEVGILNIIKYHKKNGSMKVLAIDVGKGTQDILLYDSTQRTENCIKMVLPSQTQIIAQRIMQATAKGSNILLTGTTMGGGPSSRAVHNHLQAGLKVFATKKSCFNPA